MLTAPPRDAVRRYAIPAIWLVAVVVRMLPTILGGGPHSILEYDDGVYYTAAHDLIFGPHLYTSAVFVQPPGVTYLLAPAAFVGHLIGDGYGMVLARLMTAAVDGVSAVLVYRILRARTSTRAAVFFALVYAVWAPAVTPGRTAMLEPWLTFFTLLAVVLVDRERPRPTLSGAAVGVAITVKIWAIALVPIILVWLVLRGSRSLVVRWLYGVVGATVVVLLPFLLTSPSRLFTEVVLDQAARPPVGDTVWDRMQALSGWSAWVMRLTSVHGAGLVGFAFVLGGILAAFASGRGRIWAAIGGAYLLEILVSPSFSDHYVEVVIAPILVCWGAALNRPLVRPRILVCAGAVLLAAMLAFTLTGPGATPMPNSIAEKARAARCPWIPAASVAIAAGVDCSEPSQRLDYFGIGMDLTRHATASSNTSRALESASFQRLIRSDFAHADAALLPAWEDTYWSAETRAAFKARFRLEEHTAAFDLYRATPRAGTSS